MTRRAAAGTGGAAASDAVRVQLTEHRLRWAELLPWAAAFAVFFLFPGYRLLATQILIMILFAVSLDLLVGYTGIISLGHTAFFGTGAYAAALLAAHGTGDPLLGLAAAALLAAVLGVATGWVILRTRDLTLLMLTLAVTITLYELATDFDEITGGFDGINFTNTKILGLFAFDVVWFTVNYWYALAVLFVLFFVMRAIVYSPFGRTLIGIRENTTRMHAVGSPVHLRMVTIYAISAAIAGVAGALWVQVQGNVTPAVYSFELAGDVLIMLILGGTGRLYGAFIGATVFKILENVTEQVLGTGEPYWMFAIGIVLMITVLFARRGLLGIFEIMTDYWRQRAYLTLATAGVLIVLGRLFAGTINGWIAGALGEGVITYKGIAWLALAVAFVAMSRRGLRAAMLALARALGRLRRRAARSRRRAGAAQPRKSPA